MITRCPGCRTAFRISVEHLRPAHGQVQCGICSQKFDAIEHLLEDSDFEATETPPPTPPSIGEAPAAAAATEPKRSKAAVRPGLQIDAATLEDESSDLRFEFRGVADADLHADIDADQHLPGEGTPSHASPTLRGRNEDILLSELPRMDVDREEIEALRHYLQHGPAAVTPSSPWWGVAAALLLIVLAGQLLWYQRDLLFDRLPQARVLWDRLCAGQLCELPARRDLQSLHVASRDVREHPQYGDALLVNATVVNEAPFTQPFPVVELTLFDQSGTTIGVRRFDPEEYLDSSIPIDTGMRPGQPVYIVLELAAVASHAVSFEFKFL
jgi:predicted Zn finger-like uncharacterized protein